jgi:acyl transferase domain-containing protein/phosphopantetheinyl transferase
VSERDVAIVGMAALFPGAGDLDRYAANLAAGVDAISDVPAGRWDPAFYDPAARAADRFNCRRGGFVDADARVDAAALGVMPKVARAIEPDQLLALDVARRAVADAGLDDRTIDRARIGVVIGKGNYAGAGRTRLIEAVRGAEQVVRAVRGLVPGVTDEQLAAIRRELQGELDAGGADVAIGLVPNLTASRIAHRLDLGGPAYTVDAACASALVAVDQAVAELRAGRLDAVIVGGVHVCHDEAFWSVFTQLGAVSRSQQIRPFDRRADGVLLGEGLGVVVLRRRVDAERDGDRVYAVIRGTGTSSDGRGSLLSPSVDGQVLAVTRAWSDAGVAPATVGMIEAHGTATSSGDAAELETLRRVFGGSPTGAVLGSVKSMIGHAMPAAGIAGLIKTALALHTRTLLPTLHCDEPAPALAATGLRTIARAEPWEAKGTRRAAVSAFGFGGINAHVVLDEGTPAPKGRAQVSVPAPVGAPRVLALAASDVAALLAKLRAAPVDRAVYVDGGDDASTPCRVVVLDPTAARIERAVAIVERGAAWNGREDIYFAPRAAGGDIVFAYPGVDAAFRPRLADVAAHLGETLPRELTDATSGIERIGAGLVGAAGLLHRALEGLGIVPAAMCGHSVGEWSAMIAAGVFERREVDALLEEARSGSLEVPGVAFAALGAGAEKVAPLLSGLPDIAISHDNCPHQVLVCGADASVDEVLARAKAGAILGQKLPFRSGFHSPLFRPYLEVHRKNFARMEVRAPKVPLWSATTCAPFPEEPEEIRAIAIEHLVEPVRFRAMVAELVKRGARMFIQVGPGSLVGFIDDTVKSLGMAREVAPVAIAANVAERTGMAQLARVAAMVFVRGVRPRFEWLHGVGVGTSRSTSTSTPTPTSTSTSTSTSTPTSTMGGAVITLPLAVPLWTPKQPLPLAAAGREVGASPAAAAGAVGTALAAIFDEVTRASVDVAAALTPTPAPARPTTTRVTRRLSVETHPWLLDHTFMRQPAGWPSTPDRHPVVPMTTILQLAIAEALALAPGKLAVGLEDVRAYRWLAIPTATDVHFDLTRTGDRVRVTLEGYSEVTVVLGDTYDDPPRPAPLEIATHAWQLPDPANIYSHRWMFHGPAFQGIVGLGGAGEHTITGTLETGAAPGALLDNAGQVFGLWVMLAAARDRLAMPVGLERVRFHGPHPAPGERLRCDVRIKLLDERRVVADLNLIKDDGTAWCVIHNWEDRRFDTDGPLWDVLTWPERSALGDALPDAPDGPVVVHDVYKAAPTREQLYRRYLGEAERAHYDALPPRKQRAHLAGRIAAKDALRRLLWREDPRPIFPVELAVDSDDTGRPLVRSHPELKVSIAHKDDVAIALAARHDVGVDVEVIEPRTDAFANIAFTPSELALVLPGEDRDEAMTRLWAAKEAVGKLIGTGLAGNPAKLPVTDRTGSRLLCHGHWVETRRRGAHVFAWTLPS